MADSVVRQDLQVGLALELVFRLGPGLVQRRVGHV